MIRCLSPSSRCRFARRELGSTTNCDTYINIYRTAPYCQNSSAELREVVTFGPIDRSRPVTNEKPVGMLPDSSSMVLRTTKISLLLFAVLDGRAGREAPGPAILFPVPAQTDSRRPEAPECHFLRPRNILHFVPLPWSQPPFP